MNLTSFDIILTPKQKHGQYFASLTVLVDALSKSSTNK